MILLHQTNGEYQCKIFDTKYIFVNSDLILYQKALSVKECDEKRNKYQHDDVQSAATCISDLPILPRKAKVEIEAIAM